MFWRFLALMFISSFVVTGAFIAVANYLDTVHLEERIASRSFEASVHAGFVAMLPLLQKAEIDEALCGQVLHALTYDIFSGRTLDKYGPNTLDKMVRNSRLQMAYIKNKKVICAYPAKLNSASGDKYLRLEGNLPDAPQLILKNENGGTHLSSFIQLADHPEAMLHTELHIFDALGALNKGDDFYWNGLLLFIALLNLACAVTLVPLLVKRIKLAQKAARQWADGDTTARIHDTRNDEFGDLAKSFNHLADSFSEVIKIKQDLAASDERNKLARDLHDTAKQRAFALSIQLTILKSMGESHPEESLKIASTALAIVHNLQSDLSGVIKRLSASTIAEIGIRRVLQNEVSTLLDHSRIAWLLSVPDEINRVLQASPQLTQQVFLIAIEAVTNALKHSGAHNIAIALARDAASISLTVSDDGTGLDYAKIGGAGMGLANMRLRATSLPNGRFDMSRDKDRGGTVITVTFTLEKSA